jgi:ABC-type iron transport system FetAB ATPase subunit
VGWAEEPVLVIFARGLLDELTALLDRDSQLNLVPAVQRLVKNCGLAALWVTHGLDELNYGEGLFCWKSVKCSIGATQQG